MGQDGFYFPSEEGVLRIFSSWKIGRLRPGLNPWTWVPKARTLPLDHRSRLELSFYVPLVSAWRVTRQPLPLRHYNCYLRVCVKRLYARFCVPFGCVIYKKKRDAHYILSVQTLLYHKGWLIIITLYTDYTTGSCIMFLHFASPL
jgi:hypothetical protein